MKKKLLLLTLLLLSLTYQSKAEDWTDLQHEVSLSYGALPVWDLLNHYNNYFTPVNAVDIHDDKAKFGAINISYLFYPDEEWGIGMVFSYSNNDKYILHNKQEIGTYLYSTYTICPSFKYNWYNYNFVNLYSRVNAGVAIATAKASYVDNKQPQQAYKTKAFFMYQVSPIGIELGRQIAGFVEVGFGHMGTVIAGLRYRM
ncbi:MAG: hypothetical protein PARBA_03476 [Parabacteroides sp.]